MHFLARPYEHPKFGGEATKVLVRTCSARAPIGGLRRRGRCVAGRRRWRSGHLAGVRQRAWRQPGFYYCVNRRLLSCEDSSVRSPPVKPDQGSPSPESVSGGL